MPGRSCPRSSRGPQIARPVRGRPNRRGGRGSRQRGGREPPHRAARARIASGHGGASPVRSRSRRACGARGRGWRACRTTTTAVPEAPVLRRATALRPPEETPRIRETPRGSCPARWRRPRGRGEPPARAPACPPVPCPRVPADRSAGRAPAAGARPAAPVRRASSGPAARRGRRDRPLQPADSRGSGRGRRLRSRSHSPVRGSAARSAGRHDPALARAAATAGP